MGMIKGQNEYLKFKKGEKLNKSQAIKAMCYECNGLEDSKADCQGTLCPLYPFQPYKGLRKVEDGTFNHT